MTTQSKFILVKHEATKRGLHFDLRFKNPTSKNWISFAFNEIPIIDQGKRIYGVRTNDHSEKEALFIGTIPEGEYGAGKLSKVDGGDCVVEKFSNAHMVVIFKGSKLKGLFHFVNTGVFSKGKKGNYKSKVYVFFKGKINV